MSNKTKLSRQSTSSSKPAKKNTSRIYLFAGIIGLVIIGYLFTQGGTVTKSLLSQGGSQSKTSQYAKLDGDLKILKSNVPVEAKFYPFNLDGTNMEVLTVKAKDGSIRTALNTCQVCFDSGRGYYVQDPNSKELVCQNCGNRFSPEKVEIVKGGCNPVPIMKDSKTDDGTNIIISRSVFEEYKDMFARWKKS